MAHRGLSEHGEIPSWQFQAGQVFSLLGVGCTLFSDPDKDVFPNHASGMKLVGAHTKNVWGVLSGYCISSNVGGCRTVGIYLNLWHFGRHDHEPVELGSLTAFICS